MMPIRLLAVLVLALSLFLPAEAQSRRSRSERKATQRSSPRSERKAIRRDPPSKVSRRRTEEKPSRRSGKGTPKEPARKSSPKTKSKRPPKKVAPLHQSLNAVRAKRAGVRAEIRSTRRAAKMVKRTLWQVDASLVSLSTRLRTTVTQLGQGRREQRRLGRELVVTTKRLEEVREQVRQRLKVHAMRGRGTFISVLAGTRSSSDLASRGYLMQAIARKDHELFEEYKALRVGVARRKARKDQTVRRVARLEREQRGLHANLRDTRAEKKEVLDDLRVRHAKLQAMLRQFEQDERQIENQIAAFERMLRRRIAEARRRARMRRVARRVRVRTRSGRYVEKVVTRMEREPVDEMPAFTGRFGMPVRGRVTSGFGVRFHPILRVSRMHTGIDMGAPYGAPIYAAAGGEVIAATSMRGYGNVVIVSHGGGVTTVYAHASRLFVSAGQKVRRGQPIAAVGSTGLSTGPHLHFEVRVNGRPVNPLGRL